VTRIAIVDYGAGNMVSIEQALERVGAQVTMARRPADLAGVDAIVVPGVGASGPAMARLRKLGLDEAISRAVTEGMPYLGICLGLQLLFDTSEEDGAAMLGLVPGVVSAIPGAPRLPHIGWNQFETVRAHPLVRGLVSGTAAYFVHSYAGAPLDPSVVVAETEHGGRFPSVIASGRLMGVQFHPERSGDDGLRLLRNFLSIVAGRATAAGETIVPAEPLMRASAAIS